MLLQLNAAPMTLRNLVYWLPTIAWMGLIFILSSRQTVQTTEFYLADFILKKTAHLLEYAVLATLIYHSLKNTHPLSQDKIFTLAFTLTLLYAISDETHQLYVPHRTGTVRDIFIDAIGGYIALYYISTYHLKLPGDLKTLLKRINNFFGK